MASINFSYRSPKDPAQIEIRLIYHDHTDKQRSQRTRLNFEVSREFWNEYEKGVNFRDVKKANLKTELDKHLIEVRTFVLDRFNQTMTIKAGWLKESIKRFYNPVKFKRTPDTLYDYWGYYLEAREPELKKSYRTWQKYNSTRDKLEKFQNEIGKTYLISEVDEEFKKHFMKWCRKMKYATATIKKDLSIIKQICSHAEIKGIDTSKELKNLTAKINKNPPPVIYLTFNELDRIRSIDNLPNHLTNARDWLIISCYTGQRVSDFMRFKPEMIRKAGGRKFIDFTQSKTRIDVSVPLLPEVAEIIKKRNGNFPKKISDQKYNKLIKEVCKHAGIKTPIAGKVSKSIRIKGETAKRAIPGIYEKWELITSHTGRRSFASNFYGKIPTTYLKDITGHSTESMLLKYIGKTQKDTASDAYDEMMKVKDAR